MSNPHQQQAERLARECAKGLAMDSAHIPLIAAEILKSIPLADLLTARNERDELKAYVSQIATGLGKLRARYSILVKQLCPDDSYGPDDETIDKACNVICKERDQLRDELEQCRKWLSERPSDTLYQNRVDEVTALKAELERVKGEPTQEQSLVSAIEGSYEGMSKQDLILTARMLNNGREIWRKEAEQLRSQLATLMDVARAAQNQHNNYSNANFAQLSESLTALREKFPDLLK